MGLNHMNMGLGMGLGLNLHHHLSLAGPMNPHTLMSMNSQLHNHNMDQHHYLSHGSYDFHHQLNQLHSQEGMNNMMGVPLINHSHDKSSSSSRKRYRKFDDINNFQYSPVMSLTPVEETNRQDLMQSTTSNAITKKKRPPPLCIYRYGKHIYVYL
jgi:hypothetical protein